MSTSDRAWIAAWACLILLAIWAEACSSVAYIGLSAAKGDNAIDEFWDSIFRLGAFFLGGLACLYLSYRGCGSLWSGRRIQGTTMVVLAGAAYLLGAAVWGRLL